MESGIHYAEFQITAGKAGTGIVRPLPNLDPDRFPYCNNFHFFVHSWYDEFLAAGLMIGVMAMPMRVNTFWGSGARQTGTA